MFPIRVSAIIIAAGMLTGYNFCEITNRKIPTIKIIYQYSMVYASPTDINAAYYTPDHIYGHSQIPLHLILNQRRQEMLDLSSLRSLIGVPFE